MAEKYTFTSDEIYLFYFNKDWDNLIQVLNFYEMLSRYQKLDNTITSAIILIIINKIIMESDARYQAHIDNLARILYQHDPSKSEKELIKQAVEYFEMQQLDPKIKHLNKSPNPFAGQLKIDDAEVYSNV